MNQHLDTDSIVALDNAFGDTTVEMCQHVAACTDCQREVADLQMLSTELRTVQPASSAMTSKAIAAVADHAAQEPHGRRTGRLDVLVFLTAAITALTAFDILGGAVLRPNAALLSIAAVIGIAASLIARSENLAVP